MFLRLNFFVWMLQYMEKPPRGTNSTLGLGKTKPQEAEFEKFEGDVTVPCGNPVPSGVKSDLMYNEYIVYDKAQVRYHSSAFNSGFDHELLVPVSSICANILAWFILRWIRHTTIVVSLNCSNL